MIQTQYRYLIDLKKNDIEISAFLTSIISWGNRKMIINNADKMMKIMGGSPYDFVINASEKNIKSVSFVHRTFNSDDFKFFILSLKKYIPKSWRFRECFYNKSR